MRDTDKTPAQCAAVQGKDSPCAVRERARLHALLTAWFRQWQNQYRVNQSAYYAGALNVLDEVLTLLQEDTTNE
jgi:hypothetical protein